MYKCQMTNRMSKPGQKLRRVTVLTRTREYKNVSYNEETRRFEPADSSFGTEIVKEISCTEEGEAKWNAMTLEEQAAWVKRNVK